MNIYGGVALDGVISFTFLPIFLWGYSPYYSYLLDRTLPGPQGLSGRYGEEKNLILLRHGREADHSPPTSAEVKKCGSIHPLLHTSSWRNA
jgi:hypothetical protein